jgi:hypothetical protein
MFVSREQGLFSTRSWKELSASVQGRTGQPHNASSRKKHFGAELRSWDRSKLEPSGYDEGKRRGHV